MYQSDYQSIQQIAVLHALYVRARVLNLFLVLVFTIGSSYLIYMYIFSFLLLN